MMKDICPFLIGTSTLISNHAQLRHASIAVIEKYLFPYLVHSRKKKLYSYLNCFSEVTNICFLQTSQSQICMSLYQTRLLQL